MMPFAWWQDVSHFQREPLRVGAMDELLEMACQRPLVGHAQPCRLVQVQNPQRREAPELMADACTQAASRVYANERSAIGLGWVSLVDPAAVNTVLDVSAPWRFVALLWMGYPATETRTPELVSLSWQVPLHASRTRFVR